MKNRVSLFLALGGAVLLAGCSSSPSLYQWESYQTQVYRYFKGESRDEQIAALEHDLEKTNAAGNAAPPGVYAHLGLLYVEVGNDDKAVENFTMEKERFPEATPFIDFLLKAYRGELADTGVTQ